MALFIWSPLPFLNPASGSRRDNRFQHHYQHEWNHEDESCPFSQADPAQHHPLCWGTRSRHSRAPVLLPGQSRGMEGAHPAYHPCFYLTESFWVDTALQCCLLLSSTVSSEQAHFTETLLCSSPSTGFALSSLVTQAMLGLLLFPWQSLFCSNVRHLTVAKISTAKQPGHLDTGLPILTVCLICFVSCVWFGLCRARYITPK